YTRLAAPATHRRSILFLKGDYWILRDCVETTGAHHYDLPFHFVADADPRIDTAAGGQAVRERPSDQPGLEIFAPTRLGGWRRENGWVSLCYGSRAPAPVLVFSTTGVGNQEFVTFLVPRAAQAPKAEVQELPARGGRAFDVQDGDTHDVLLLGPGCPMEAAEIVSDFEWTWMRGEPNSNTLTEFVLLGGTFLRFQGREIVRTAARCSYAVVRCLGEEVIVESDRPALQSTGASYSTL
ncbi:MAG TPA: heparinase II/III family protein, partial [Gemmataceae bacterium]|nr:heparinase II/III family protein [Gemmataceae bacterium]